MPVRVSLEDVQAALPTHEVLRQLDSGGFGQVFEARHRYLKRHDAVKVLMLPDPNRFLDHDEWESALRDLEERFLEEGRLLTGLEHPHIVRIYDFKEWPVDRLTRQLLVMEFMEGGGLAARHRAARLTPPQVCAVGIAVAEALHHAHTSNPAVLHLDIKPDNILFTANDRPKVADFGIAKIFEGTMGMTAGVGTPGYMPPEQYSETATLKPASDVYAVGATLYRLLTRQLPYPRTLAVPRLPRPRPDPRELPEPLARVLLRAVEDRISDRHATAHEFAIDLAQAGARVFGADWLGQCGIQLMLDQEIRAAATSQRGRHIPRDGLDDVDLRGRELSDQDLAGADLRGKDLTGATLRRTILAEATLRDANLTRAFLENVSLVDADLSGANLTDARLVRTDLTGAALRGSRFQRTALLSCRTGPIIDAHPELAHAAIPGRDPANLVIPGTAAAVTAVVFSPDGAIVATGAGDGSAALWDVVRGRRLRTFAAHDGRTLAVAVSPDGVLVATGGADGSARLWDTDSGEKVLELAGHTCPVTAVAFSPDGTVVATAGDDGSVLLWNSRSGRRLHGLGGHDGWVYAVAFSPDGAQVATGGADRTARLWDARSGWQTQMFAGHSGWVCAAVFSPDGATLATGSYDGSAGVWDIASAQQTDRHLRRFTEWMRPVAFRPDGAVLAIAGDDRTMELWDVREHSRITTFNGHARPVNAVACSPDRRLLASGARDGTTRLWTLADGSPVATLLALDDGWATFLPDGAYKLAGTDRADRFYWTVKDVRFGAGELDGHDASIRRLPEDQPLTQDQGPDDDPTRPAF
jgi:hypothetical protein